MGSHQSFSFKGLEQKSAVLNLMEGQWSRWAYLGTVGKYGVEESVQDFDKNNPRQVQDPWIIV